jgi:hypothetical protein
MFFQEILMCFPSINISFYNFFLRYIYFDRLQLEQHKYISINISFFCYQSVAKFLLAKYEIVNSLFVAFK